MSFFIVCIAWCIALYSLRLAFGNLAYSLVMSTPQPVLARAAEFLGSEEADDSVEDEPLIRFLKRFYMIRMLSLLVLAGEALTIGYFVVEMPGNPFIWAALSLRFFMVWVFRYWLSTAAEEDDSLDPFSRLKQVPGWVRNWERIGRLLYSLCYVGMILSLLDFLPAIS